MRFASSFRWLMIAVAVVAVALAGAATALAQVRLSSLDDVRREVAAGDVVTIVRGTDDPLEGRLLRVEDATLQVRTDGRTTTGQRQRLDLTIPWSELSAIERRRDSSRDGALIGAGIGGGISLATFVYAAAVDYNDIDGWGPLYVAGGAVVTGIAAVVGWAIDRAHSKPHVRFDGPSAEGATGRSTSESTSGKLRARPRDGGHAAASRRMVSR